VSLDMTKDTDGIVYRQEQCYKTFLHNTVSKGAN